MKSSAKPSLQFTLALIATIFSLTVIVLGSYTRLVDAGLGCPDWPSCYGHLWVPDTKAEIARANERFQETPVETDKTWPEQLHRLLATSLGLLILLVYAASVYVNRARLNLLPWKSTTLLLGLFFSATAARIFTGDILDVPLLLIALTYFANLIRLSLATRDTARAYEHPYLLAATVTGLVILQGLFGMWTVTLYLWPQVVTAHLMGGFTIFSLLWLLASRSYGARWEFASDEFGRLHKLQGLAILALVLVIIQVMLGGWVASNYAALACPDLPQCRGQWLPPVDMLEGFNIFQQVGPNYLGGQMDNDARVAIHLVHRIGAAVVTVVLLGLSLKCFASGLRPAKRYAFGMLAILAIQVALGISNIVFYLPLWVAVMHNLVGAILMAFMVQFVHRIVTARSVTIAI